MKRRFHYRPLLTGKAGLKFLAMFDEGFQPIPPDSTLT